jgi:hypothetical protein
LVGIIDKQSLALVELKTKDSAENPRRALLEILSYGAIVQDRNNFAKIAAEIDKKWNLKLCEEVQHIILAPQEYWKRWNGKERIDRWKAFCELCNKLRDGPLAIDIQCLVLEMPSSASRNTSSSSISRLVSGPDLIGLIGQSHFITTTCRLITQPLDGNNARAHPASRDIAQVHHDAFP